MGKEIRCPYCNSDKTEYIDMVDRFINEFCCDECDEYFYVEEIYKVVDKITYITIDEVKEVINDTRLEVVEKSVKSKF